MKFEQNNIYMRCFCCVLQLLQRRNRLYEASQLRRHLLEESYKFQTFQRDCDETKSWINEKLKTASDENYLVSAALRSRMNNLHYNLCIFTISFKIKY